MSFLQGQIFLLEQNLESLQNNETILWILDFNKTGAMTVNDFTHGPKCATVNYHLFSTMKTVFNPNTGDIKNCHSKACEGDSVTRPCLKISRFNKNGFSGYVTPYVESERIIIEKVKNIITRYFNHAELSPPHVLLFHFFQSAVFNQYNFEKYQNVTRVFISHCISIRLFYIESDSKMFQQNVFVVLTFSQ